MTEQNGVERSTATDILSAMLDERGVKYKVWDGGTHPITVWYVDGQAFEFVEYRLINGAKQVSNNPWDNDGHCMLTITNRHCTPEQAIAATLGRGTCHDVGTFKSWGLFTCSNRG